MVRTAIRGSGRLPQPAHGADLPGAASGRLHRAGLRHHRAGRAALLRRLPLVPGRADQVQRVRLPRRAAIALGRALAEAALSRLGVISGARNDVDYDAYRETARPAEPAELAEFGPQPDPGLAGLPALEPVIRHCASQVAAVTGVEPFAVRLDHEDIGIPAVKVIAPGLRMMGQHGRQIRVPVATVPGRAAATPGPGRVAATPGPGR